MTGRVSAMRRPRKRHPKTTPDTSVQAVRAARFCPGVPLESLSDSCGLSNWEMGETLQRVTPRGHCTDLWEKAWAVANFEFRAEEAALTSRPPPALARQKTFWNPYGAAGTASWQERTVRVVSAPRRAIVAASGDGDDLSEFGKSNAAAHRHAPPALITRLALHDAELVRRSAAANPNCPPEVLGLLKQDPEGTVRQYALNHWDRSV